MAKKTREEKKSMKEDTYLKDHKRTYDDFIRHVFRSAVVLAVILFLIVVFFIAG